MGTRHESFGKGWQVFLGIFMAALEGITRLHITGVKECSAFDCIQPVPALQQFSYSRHHLPYVQATYTLISIAHSS